MKILEREFTFLGDETPPVVGSPDGSLWRSKVVGTTPTVKSENGLMKLALTATEESQSALLYLGDQLSLDIDNLIQVDIYAKVSSASLSPAVSLAFGLIAAHSDDLDDVAYAAMFRCMGDNDVLVETDDGINDLSAATGQVIGTTSKRFTIDFANGIKTLVPGPSSGGKGCVLFNVDDIRNNLQAVARATRFNMENYAGGLQLFAQIQKGEASSVAGSITGSLYIERIVVKYKSNS
jgi:hypothetical protein